MKKVLLAFVLFTAAFPVWAQPAVTDPFFMLNPSAMLLDSELGYMNNYEGGDGTKMWRIKETFRYGLADRWEAYASLGLANLKMDNYKESGLTDPDFGIRYRASENLAGKDLLLDLGAHFSPAIFDSPWDNSPDGVAKGSTDFGVGGLIGRQASSVKEWTWGGFAAINFVGSTDQGKSATDFYLGGLGKYYVDTINSLDVEARLGLLGKRADGGDSDTSFRISGGYSRVLAEDVDLMSKLGFATHSADGAKTEVFLSVGLRWLM